MMGLVIKDFYSLKKSYTSTFMWAIMINLYFIMFALATVYGNFSDIVYDEIADFTQFLYVVCLMPFIVGSTAISSFGYDKMCGFNEQELTLPVTDNKKVLAKYISSGFCVLSSIVHLIVPVICCKLANKEFDNKILFIFIIAMELTAVAICIFIPLVYYGKLSKATSIIIHTSVTMLLFILAFLYSAFDSFVNKFFIDIIIKNIELTTLIILGIAAVIFLFSYRLAIIAYKRGRGVTQ